MWNHSNLACSWDRACHRIAHPAVGEQDATTDSADSELPGFALIRREVLRWSEHISRAHYLRRWATVSSLLVADGPDRERMLGEIEAVLDQDEETRGRAQLELPQVTGVFVYRRI